MNTQLNSSGIGPAQWDKLQRQWGASFLQSAIWAQFQQTIGHKPHYVSGEGWSCLLIERKAMIGRYLFSPYGPTITKNAKPKAALESIKAYGATQKADWLRLEPIGVEAQALRDALRSAGGRPAIHEAEPHLTRLVDLTRSKEEILASLSQTTRNIIHRNQQETILTFRTSRDPDDIPILTHLLDLVASRKKVGFFTADYYKKQAEILMPAGLSVLEIAYHENQPVGASLIHDFAKTSSYTNAASLPEARDKNVSALLLWQVMLNAKDRGNTIIDLYGVAPDDAGPGHPWYGFSGFKRKFGGTVIEHAGTWDIELTSKYKLYHSAVSAKKLIRGR